MQMIERCYDYLFWGVLVVLGLSVLIALIYILRSRLTVDRIIGINLIGSIITIIICILARVLGEDYLADVAVVYVVLAFISVMMLCRIYINLYDKDRGDRNDR